MPGIHDVGQDVRRVSASTMIQLSPKEDQKKSWHVGARRKFSAIAQRGAQMSRDEELERTDTDTSMQEPMRFNGGGVDCVI